jgi:predicted GNAT family acetyltransferase
MVTSTPHPMAYEALYRVTRHNENVIPLCVNVIHHIVLTLESYLVNRQKKIKKIHPFPTFF